MNDQHGFIPSQEEQESARIFTEYYINEGPDTCLQVLGDLEYQFSNYNYNSILNSEQRQSIVLYRCLRRYVAIMTRRILNQTLFDILGHLNQDNDLAEGLSASFAEETSSIVPPMSEETFQLFTQHLARKPVSEENYNLHSTCIAFPETDICVICMCPCLDESENVMCPPCKSCKHNFHVNCLHEAFKTKSECPTCREQWTVSTDETAISAGVASKVAYNIKAFSELQGGNTIDSLASLFESPINLETFLSNPHFAAITCWKDMFSIAGFQNEDDGIHISLPNEEACDKASQFVNLLREAWVKNSIKPQDG